MKRFAELLETLVLTPSRNAKIGAMARYFQTTPDPDRGFALAAITRDLTLSNLKAGALRQLAMDRVDPELFLMSYDYVGDLAETISLIWPHPGDADSSATLPGVADFITGIESRPKVDVASHLAALLDSATPAERWAMIKLATGGLRVGVSARLAKTALAAYGGQAVQTAAEYQAGAFEIQDLASQQIAAAVDAKAGDKVWDACAGAGGKSLAIAARMSGRGSVTATDLHEFKLNELKRRAKRAQIQNIRTFSWDGQQPLRLPAEVRKQQGFDWVLVDAPCTSAGTWRRNPDARWRFNDSDTRQLQQLQQQLLQHASEALRPGGYLVYATCSWQVAENEHQVEQFLSQHPQFELLEQCMLGAPDEDADCMFYAKLQRQS